MFSRLIISSPYKADFGQTWNVLVETKRRRDELQQTEDGFIETL